MSHSKRNTSRPVFTSHERALAKSAWASSSARLSRDSFLPFGSCALCLEIARDPVSCSRGDLFCRECALANLLAQKRELKRNERARLDAEENAARVRVLAEGEDQARAVRDFEMTQAGLRTTEQRGKQRQQRTPEPNLPSAADADSMALNADNKALIVAGSKRKFELDEDELERIAKADKMKARKAIEDEKAAKPSLPSFWTPSLTPDVHDSKVLAIQKRGKAMPICPSSSEDSRHKLSMQKLVSVQFDEDEDPSSKAKRRICPSCRKALSNASKAVLAKQCGHVLCRNCTDKFICLAGAKRAAEASTPLACYVCDTPFSPGPEGSRDAKGSLPAGLVELRSDGTGFSARGANAVKKSSVAFQC